MKLKKAKAPEAGAATGTATDEAPKGRKNVLLVGLLAVVVAAAAGWWFMIRPAGAEEEPVPGSVVALEPIQVNLASGHYLKIGIALQAVEGIEEVDGSKALDATIELFSGQDMAQLTVAKHRTALKEKLVHELEEEYEGEVIGVYFTEFVTQ
jgi:flagellar FliL protein